MCCSAVSSHLPARLDIGSCQAVVDGGAGAATLCNREAGSSALPGKLLGALQQGFSWGDQEFPRSTEKLHVPESRRLFSWPIFAEKRDQARSKFDSRVRQGHGFPVAYGEFHQHRVVGKSVFRKVAVRHFTGIFSCLTKKKKKA